MADKVLAEDTSAEDTVLEVRDLTVGFGPVRAVQDVSLSIGQGMVYGLVGESGCGKSTLAYSLLGLVPPPGRIVSGAVRFRGQDLARMSYAELRRLRAQHIAVVFQAAMSAFNPVITIGAQVEHILEAHPACTPAVRRAVSTSRSSSSWSGCGPSRSGRPTRAGFRAA